jgi:hypothetical protein
MKKCYKCKIFKSLDLFHKDSSKKDGLDRKCKTCKSAYQKNNKEHFDNYKKEWNEKHPNYIKNYKAANRVALNKKASEYEKNKKAVDVNFKLRRLLRDRLRKAIKNGYKGGSAVEDLGCSVDFFKKYLESQFQPGMTWGNHGQWHIDHIKPLSLFNLTDREQFLIACHYSNLQPLWATDNIKKSNRVA